MISSTNTVAFLGIHVLKIKIEVQITSGLPSFSIVGLGDKAITESRERVRAALHSLNLHLPPQRITVNLAPADVFKEGTHYDLPIAMALLSAMKIIPAETIKDFIMMGELGLDGSIRSVSGILPAAIEAKKEGFGFICPEKQGSEALWAEAPHIIAAPDLLSLLNHLKGEYHLPSPQPINFSDHTALPDLIDIKGQESAKRALEIAAAGGHNMLMIGPPGTGKSMLAARLASLLPELSKDEMLEVSQIYSVAGLIKEGHFVSKRPFRAPHHSATMASLTGGGTKARPGEISLAHRGVLFLDELPEFNRSVLESLRQPMETGFITVARANAHLSYPARFQLITAMNPCKCGYLGVFGNECAKAPKCGLEYLSKISGPLLDRIDLQIEVPAVNPWDLTKSTGENSATVANRVKKALEFAKERFKETPILRNAEADGSFLEKYACIEDEALKFLQSAAQKLHLSARGYHRTIRVARTIADLSQSDSIKSLHVKEALFYKNPLKKNG
ncbi:MAG: YifB family Mg chelatase-like AAA ATPase [Alphaproteobacteria bacterium]|nr:YifB family Mg chelatase-like AAA ATPase [Alphaproteobacteria bacterium]